MVGLTLITGIIVFLFGIGTGNWGLLTVSFILFALTICFNVLRSWEKQRDKEWLELNEWSKNCRKTDDTKEQETEPLNH